MVRTLSPRNSNLWVQGTFNYTDQMKRQQKEDGLKLLPPPLLYIRRASTAGLHAPLEAAVQALVPFFTLFPHISLPSSGQHKTDGMEES